MLFSVLCLGVGIGCYETAAFLFVLGLALSVLSSSLLSEKPYDKLYFLQLFVKVKLGLIVLIGSLGLKELILRLIKLWYKIETNGGYVSNYIAYQDENIILQLLNLLKQLNSQVWQTESLTALNIRIVIIIIVVLSISACIKAKNIFPFIVGIGAIFANFLLIIVTGNIHMPYRTIIYYGLFVGVGYLLIFEYFWNKRKLFRGTKIIILILSVFIINITLKQSQELAQVFYADYTRYQWDIQRAAAYNYAIRQKTVDENKPVVFIGTAPAYTNLPYHVPYNSYFSFWDDRTLESFNFYVHYFFPAHGYNYGLPSREQIIEAYEISKQVDAFFPAKEAIIEEEDYIIVKLSNKCYDELEKKVE